MVKIIFLDIDGVLTSLKSANQFGNYKTFLPSSVEALNHILKVSGAQIVISSAWRIGRTIEELRTIFNDQGIDGSKIIGLTPILRDKRGHDIDSWLKTARLPVKSFVIIDDNSDMEHHIGRLVQTTFEDGLEMSHAEKAIAMLLESTH